MAREHVAAANALGREGRHDEAAATLRTALALDELRGGERAHVLAHLASELRMAERLDDASAAAREAVALATASEDPRAVAYTQFVLGTTLLAVFEDADAAELLPEVMDALDLAAETYARLGSIDFSSVLLTMADMFRMIGEHDTARGVYTRVTRELGDPKWAITEGFARHADSVRGRAFLGLGAIDLATGRRAEAAEMFEAAVKFLIGAADISGAPLLEDIAGVVEAELGDGARAASIRAAAQALR